MKFTELKDDLKGGVRGIYLIEGSDAYFRTKAEEMIKSVCLTMPELNYAAYDGSSYKGASLSEITSAVSVFPFMAEKRVIKLSEFYPTDDEYEKYLKATFEDFPETTALLIVNSGAKKGAELKRKKCVTYIDCSKAEREVVARWVYATLKKAQIASSVEACEAVADYCLCDMSRVAGEVEKLVEWCDNGKITKADVDELVYKDADYRVYQMTGAIAVRDYAAFIGISRDLLSKGFDENAILASLLNYFKNLLTSITANNSDGKLASSLKMSDYVFTKTKKQANAIGEERLIALINGIYGLASAVKSGKITASGAFESATAQLFFV